MRREKKKKNNLDLPRERAGTTIEQNTIQLTGKREGTMPSSAKRKRPPPGDYTRGCKIQTPKV